MSLIVVSPRLTSALTGPIVVAVLYFGSAVLALHVVSGVDGIATIWPPSGILLAALLLSPRRRIGHYLATCVVASFAANRLFDAGMAQAALMSVANMAEALLGWWLLRGRGAGPPRFLRPAETTRFCSAATAAAAAGALLATVAEPAASVRFGVSWFMTDLLGMLILTPLILMAAEAVYGHNSDLAVRRRDLVLAVLLVAGVSAAAFAQSGYPVLFLPMVALLAATYWLGPLGSAAGVLTIAAIGATMTANGHGPVMLLRADAAAMSLFMQFYLLVMMGTALPLAGLLATRHGLLRQVAESNRLMQLAERTAQMGHWRMDLVSETLLWSPEVFRLHGLPVGTPPPLAAAIDAYHPDDRQRVSDFVAALIAGGGGEFGFEARLVTPDGTVRHVLSRGHTDHGPDGSPSGVFGVVQDVTERVQAAAALEAARADAEAAADTDQLTGLASRRRVLRVLDQAVAAAREKGQPLSVAIFDIDHFKAVNDRYGHQTGDAVLARVARDAVGAARRDNLVGRLGGEEFLIVLPGADTAIAMMVAERVRGAIAAGGADGAAGEPPGVTISIGVAQLDADVSATVLLARADQALYAAKRSGRNRSLLAA